MAVARAAPACPSCGHDAEEHDPASGCGRGCDCPLGEAEVRDLADGADDEDAGLQAMEWA